MGSSPSSRRDRNYRHDARRYSRSRSRDRRTRDRKSRSRERYSDRTRHDYRNNRQDRKRSRSPSADRNDTKMFKKAVKSGEKTITVNIAKQVKQVEQESSHTKVDEIETELIIEDSCEDEMQRLMGFSGFDSTKGSHVLGNEDLELKKKAKRDYRQYMHVTKFKKPGAP